jgi:Flp pilus assembly protein TadD
MTLDSTAVGLLLAIPLVCSAAAAQTTEASNALTAPISFGAAHAAYREGDFPRAADLFAAYREANPQDVWGPYMQGLSLWKSGRAELAEEPLRAALALEPDLVKGLVNLGRVLVDLGRPAEAVPLLERAVELEPDSAAARRVLARAQHASGNREEARETYLAGLRLDPNDPWSLNNYGLSLIKEESFEDALAPLAKACLAKPGEACFWNNLGIALERSGRPGPAVAAYRQALAVDGKYEKARVSLARIESRGGVGIETRLPLEDLAVGFSAARAPDVAIAAAPEALAPGAGEEREEAGGEAVADSEGKKDAEAEPEKTSKKKRKRPARKKRKKTTRRPAVEVSGLFALRFVYDDNIIHYSDEDLYEFETDPTLGKYLIETAGDWIVRPRLELTLASRRLTGKKLEALLRFSSWKYFTNGVKDNLSLYVRLKHPGFGSDNFQATFYHAPQSYLRNFKDRPPLVSHSTPMVNTEFRYTSTSAGLGYWRRLAKSWDGKLEIKRSWRYYNQPFMENDNWEWKFGGYLSYRIAKPLKVTAGYDYSVVEARAADEVNETPENSDDGDASYERDSYDLTLSLYVPKTFLQVNRIDLSGQYQAYYFTSEKPPDEDRYHVGRKDEVRRLEISWSTRTIFKIVSLEGGYRYTVRDSSAPWESGEGESIDEDKDYTDNRVWVGVEYEF